MRPQPTLIVKCVKCSAEREYLLPKIAGFEYDQKLREYIDKLEAELTALKTPHPCAECEHRIATACCCKWVATVYIEDATKPWLCGHFQQKKGTQ